jgi:CotH kinase protein/Lamin Tail Domain
MNSRSLAVLISSLVLVVPVRTQTPDLYEEGKVRTLELTFKSATWLSELKSNKRAERNIPADLKVDGRVYKNIGVRSRGVTSFSWGSSNGKLPLRITLDAYTPGKNLYGHKVLILNNGYADPTYCREIIAYKIMASRVPASRANYVRVVCNGVNYGIYVSVEAPNRDLMKKHFRRDEGNRYQGWRDFTNTYWSFSQLPTYLPLKSAKMPTSYHDLYAMTTVLHGTVANRFAKLQDSLDLDQCLRQIAVDTVIGNHDGLYVHNYYLYHDPYHGRFSTVPWDLNQTFRWTRALPNRLSYSRKLIEPGPWLKAYHGHVRSLMQEWCDWKTIGPMVTRLQALIDAEVKKDPRGYGYAAFKANVTNKSGFIPGLKPTVDSLCVNLRAYAPMQLIPPTLAAPTQSPATPKDRDPVWVSVVIGGKRSNVLLRYRIKGRFLDVKMFDDGKHQDGAANDNRYGAAIPPQLAGVPVEYYFFAENINAIDLLPKSGAHEAFRYRVLPRASGIVINEVLPRNVNGIKDNKGEREDWIELLNPTASSLVVGGMYLTCDFSKPTLWRLPANLSLNPGERVIIWADAETNQGPFHASFKIDRTGEEIFLYAKDGKTLVDFVTLTEQAADVSTGRVDDGAPGWVTYPKPTPIQSNGLTSCGSRTWSARDADRHALSISMTGLPKIGTTPKLTFAGAQPNQPYLVMVGIGAASVPIKALRLSLFLKSPILAEFVLPGTATGSLTVPMPLPNDPKLDGFKMSLQAFSIRSQILVTSNGLEMRFCK